MRMTPFLLLKKKKKKQKITWIPKTKLKCMLIDTNNTNGNTLKTVVCTKQKKTWFNHIWSDPVPTGHGTTAPLNLKEVVNIICYCQVMWDTSDGVYWQNKNQTGKKKKNPQQVKQKIFMPSIAFLVVNLLKCMCATLLLSEKCTALILVIQTMTELNLEHHEWNQNRM